MKKSGISPVIATVILIAIAVAVAIAVAFWAAGLTGAFTRFEKLEIINTFVTRNSNDYTITISYKNSGSTDITIENIFVHEKPLSIFWSSATVNRNPMSNIHVPQGATGQMVVSFPDNDGVKAFVEGQMVQMKVQTASGVYYIGVFNMP